MKKTVLFVLVLLCVVVKGQDLNAMRQKVVAEGKKLYKSEMASWYGTDLFFHDYTNKSNVGGYFSYTEGAENKCVFFSRASQPRVIGTIVFDDSFDTKKAMVYLEERDLTAVEHKLFLIRQGAIEEVRRDTSLFKYYQGMNLNFVPLLGEKENKVYVLTGPTEHGIVVFGNDYLLTFDKKNQLKSKKALHKNIIPIAYNPEEKGQTTLHNHLHETGDLMTATDICTLMLYGKFTGWKQHNVVSEKYLNVWNFETEDLYVIPMDALKKMDK